MLRITSVAAFAISASVCSAAAIDITQVKGRFSCPDLSNQQACAQRFEGLFTTRHPKLLRRKDDKLSVRLLDGRYFALEAQNPDNANFDVLELQVHGRFAVIRQQFYEGNSWQLLDRKKGELTEIYGYPLFSPNSTRFVAASEDLQAGYSDNVLDVYTVSASGVSRVFRAVPVKGPDWAARDVRWDGNGVIRFVQTRYTGNPPTGFDEHPAYLSLEDGKWAFHSGDTR